MVSDSGMRVLVSLRESGHAGLACMLGELRSVGHFPVAFMVLVWLVLVFRCCCFGWRSCGLPSIPLFGATLWLGACACGATDAGDPLFDGKGYCIGWHDTTQPE